MYYYLSNEIVHRIDTPAVLRRGERYLGDPDAHAIVCRAQDATAHGITFVARGGVTAGFAPEVIGVDDGSGVSLAEATAEVRARRPWYESSMRRTQADLACR